jgi:hypothetical protein
VNLVRFAAILILLNAPETVPQERRASIIAAKDGEIHLPFGPVSLGLPQPLIAFFNL